MEKFFWGKSKGCHTALECSFFRKTVLKKGYEAAAKKLMKEGSFLDDKKSLLQK